MNSYQKKLEKISKNDYGVNSGVYSLVDPKINMRMNARGEYRAIFSGEETEDTYRKLLNVDMMSDFTPNEDIVAQHLFSSIKNINHDPIIGFYSGLYIGHVAVNDFRKNGSSGGMTTWILTELFKQKKIDGVIHVQEVNPETNNGVLFKYVISRNEKSIKKGAKSRYYPMEMSEVLKIVKKNPGRYAIVAIPEFIMELRLLAKVDELIQDRIKYTVGLICGHQKTANYAEALAWEQGIQPGKLASIDFRVKQPQSTASNYLHKMMGEIDGKNVQLIKDNSQLFVGYWPFGFFKSKFSDFTDNVFNEVADVVLGDAWLPEYEKDGMGNNIVITRNNDINEMILSGIKNFSLNLDIATKDQVINSQLGLVHHARDELPFRLFIQKIHLKWVPKKRVSASLRLTILRARVQCLRFKMSTSSHSIYAIAKNKEDWTYFERKMINLIKKYKLTYKLIRFKETVFIRTVNIVRNKLRPRTRIKGIRRIIKPRTRAKGVIWKSQKFFMRIQSRHADGAILTLTGFLNYGNIIQRYALQEHLRKNGRNFVSYWNNPFYPKRNDKLRFEYTKKFVDQYIWRKPYDKKDKYNNYIVGSDQVWRNWSYENVDMELGYYFLNFLKNKNVKRIAYAASFGHDKIENSLIQKNTVNYISEYIKKFDYISVRESSGARILRNNWGVNSELVIDPTMLLQKKEYETLINNSKYELRKVYPIVAYVLVENEEKNKIIEEIGRLLNKKIDRFFPASTEKLPPVEQWLKNFRDSELVITDSFHGTVFSLIFNTPFIVVENSSGGLSRLSNLLELFNLTDRSLDQIKIDNFKAGSIKEIDWKKVNDILESLRKQSSNWLNNALNDSTKESS